MKTIGTCKECKFRAKEGLCTNGKIMEGYEPMDEEPLREEDSDALIYSYEEGGRFWVGPDFGCIHWTAKQ
jgi:hypothetical protein